MDEKLLIQEADFKAVRSSGAGGQNVNKVSSKVELYFNLPTSVAFSEAEKERIRKKLSSRLTNNGDIILQCDESRSQHRNREIIVKRFLEMMREGIKKPKLRKKTKPSKAAKLKRLREKKLNAEKKSNRKNPLKD